MFGAVEPDYDVIIVGAGLSGINSAYRVQTQLPGARYVILEGKSVLGGTWELFKYPGIRSDSDLFTFGFSWRPWTGDTRFASGEQIATYIKEAAQEHGIDKRIMYNHQVFRLSFDSSKAIWTISADNAGVLRTITTKFLIMGTGYYDYNEALKVHIPGIDKFEGQVVHPQFWPEGLDYAGKRIVIIGSGATAVTLLPNLAKSAAHVTMLQRSPSYVMSIPNTVYHLPTWIPSRLKYAAEVIEHLILPYLFYSFCRLCPNAARSMIKKETKEQLPPTVPHDPHFNPVYNPWDQRLCMSPDGDFFESLRAGKADVKTGNIQTMKGNHILLKSGESIETDIIISATGLKLQFAGGCEVVVDGKTKKFSDCYAWRGIMVQDIPNCAFVIGYTTNSWTLGADCTALIVCRLLKQMERESKGYVVARTDGYENMKPLPVLDMKSTYVTANLHQLPKAGDSGPWKARANYFKDVWTAKFGDLSAGLEFV